MVVEGWRLAQGFWTTLVTAGLVYGVVKAFPVLAGLF